MASRVHSLCVLLLALLGCEPADRPGDLVGRYDVTGALTRNDCGSSALPAEDPLLFEVEIRDNGGEGLWFLGSPNAISGTLELGGVFRFQHDQLVEVVAPGTRTVVDPQDPNDFLDPEPDIKVNAAGCQMRVVETVDGALHRDSRGDAGVGEPIGDEVAADLIGTNQIEVAVVAGSDCSASMSSNGGPFLELPCVAEYALTGTLLAE
jgi:hypothetical protein